MMPITVIILCVESNRECLLGAYYVPCALPGLRNSRGQYGQNSALLEFTFFWGRQTLKKIRQQENKAGKGDRKLGRMEMKLEREAWNISLINAGSKPHIDLGKENSSQRLMALLKCLG